MRICFLSIFNYSNNIGGVENHIYFMSRELLKLNNEVLIFQPLEEEKYTENIYEDNGIKVIFIPVKSPRFFKILSKYNGIKIIGFLTAFLNKAKFITSHRKIAGTIMDYHCDIVHQHDFISNVFTTKYLTKKGKHCVLTNHTGEYIFLKKNTFGRAILKKLLSHYKFIIGPSKELTPTEFNKNSYTIYNGVNTEIFYEMNTEEKTLLRKKYGFSDNDFLVLCPRRWAPTKGIIYLVKSILKFDYPENYRFLFAGSDYTGYPGYKEEINTLIQKSTNKYKIIKLGNLSIPKMQEVYNIADLVIIPSLMEAVSLSALEAMATGTPVISTNVGGMQELIKNEKNGVLIPPKAPKEIYTAIMKFNNPDFYNKIKKESLKTAKDFSWTSIAKKTFNLYQKATT